LPLTCSTSIVFYSPHNILPQTIYSVGRERSVLLCDYCGNAYGMTMHIKRKCDVTQKKLPRIISPEREGAAFVLRFTFNDTFMGLCFFLILSGPSLLMLPFSIQVQLISSESQACEICNAWRG